MLCRLNLSQIIAVSIETAFQNGSIAFILLQLTLDDPKNDIATIAPIAQIMLTGMISIRIKVSLKFNLHISQTESLASFFDTFVIHFSFTFVGLLDCLEGLPEIHKKERFRGR